MSFLWKIQESTGHPLHHAAGWGRVENARRLLAAGASQEARNAAARFRSLCTEDADFPRYAANHARICKQQEDANNWIEGYRKAGLLD